jgi:ABC-type Fe2+-enterobactin transport system substrate-binding protein
MTIEPRPPIHPAPEEWPDVPHRDYHNEIRAERDKLRAEVERLRCLLSKDTNTVMIAHEDGDHQRLSREVGRITARAESAEAALATAREALVEAGAMLRNAYILSPDVSKVIYRVDAALAALPPTQETKDD